MHVFMNMVEGILVPKQGDVLVEVCLTTLYISVCCVNSEGFGLYTVFEFDW